MIKLKNNKKQHIQNQITTEMKNIMKKHKEWVDKTELIYKKENKVITIMKQDIIEYHMKKESIIKDINK